jgi:TolB protein
MRCIPGAGRGGPRPCFGARLARYSQTGQLIKVLATGPGYDTAIYSSDGTTLAVSGSQGLELVSNHGGVIRRLPVPGAAGQSGCWPHRWWNSGTVLADCMAAGADRSRLWLVPVSGARPTALTPQRGAASRDLGDFDAWQLPSGLFLQAAGPCGTVQILRQAPNGPVIPVLVPHTTGNNNWIVTVAGSRMLLKAQTGCPGSTSLVWYNPRTQAEQWLIRTPGDQFGVLGAVAYYSRENAG